MRSSGLNLNRLYPSWKILFPLGVFHLRFRGLWARPPMVDLLSFYGIFHTPDAGRRQGVTRRDSSVSFFSQPPSVLCTRVCVFSFSLWGRVTGFMFACAYFRTLSLGLCGKKLLVLLCPPASGRGERLTLVGRPVT